MACNGTCRGCGRPLAALHQEKCSYWHPWPRDRVDNVQTCIEPLTTALPGSDRTK